MDTISSGAASVVDWLASRADVVVRFQGGELDVLTRVLPQHVAALETRAAAAGYALHDLGASLEYNFLFFNLGSTDERPRLALAQDVRFRQAVSLAVDRAGIARLALACLVIDLAEIGCRRKRGHAAHGFGPLGADDATGAGAIVDDKRLAEFGTQPRHNDARDNISTPTCWEWNHHVNRFVWKGCC